VQGILKQLSEGEIRLTTKSISTLNTTNGKIEYLIHLRIWNKEYSYQFHDESGSFFWNVILIYYKV